MLRFRPAGPGGRAQECVRLGYSPPCVLGHSACTDLHVSAPIYLRNSMHAYDYACILGCCHIHIPISLAGTEKETLRARKQVSAYTCALGTWRARKRSPRRTQASEYPRRAIAEGWNRKEPQRQVS